ncbi:hypothetical protein [Arcobacter sp.]|uniref:hypothetical protein n=1 Tax=unclassified Arcobacter TaxID=2593671 RepID=UPI003B00B2E9
MNKKINIKIKDTKKVEELLAEVQKQSYERTIDLKYIDYLTNEAETKLKEELHIAKKYWDGIIINYGDGMTKGKYSYIATYVKIKYVKSQWIIIECFRAKVGSRISRIELTEEAKLNVRNYIPM